MKKILNFIKEKPEIFVILIILLLTGLSFRAYHAGYPAIGYHNWKETHYLTEARNFAEDGFFEHGFFVPENDYPRLNADPSGAHADTFPTTSIFIAIAFKLFGTSLLAARSVVILFSLATIFAMYLLVKELFKREDVALTAAALTAINPLLVFFGRNVQLMPVGLFFMLLGGYYFVKWFENKNRNNFIYMALFVALAGLTKYTFLVILVPMIITFLYKQPIIKSFKEILNFKKYWLGYLLLITVPLWMAYDSYLGKVTGKAVTSLPSLNLSVIYTVAWWSAIKSFMLDNYTLLGLFFAFIGLFLVSYFYNKREKFGELFTLSYAFSSLLFIVLLATKLDGHSYHQYPIAPMFIILIAYTFTVISGTITRSLTAQLEKDKEKIGKVLKIAVLIVLFLSIHFIGGAYSGSNSIERQFDQQFPGLDVAGEYIQEHSSSDERLIFSGGQSFGVLWHANRKGYYNINSVEDVMKAEELGSEWVFIYQWGLNEIGTAKMDYTFQNYELKQAGFMGEGEQGQLVYLLLRKGGSFNMDDLNEKIQNNLVRSKEYERTTGPYKLYYVNIN